MSYLSRWLLLSLALLPALSAQSAEPMRQWAAAQAKSPRIVGGTTAAAGDWPWIVALVYKSQTAYDGQFCAGALIHPRWILTAAHCVNGETIHTFDVLFGRQKLTKIGSGEWVNVQRIVSHPGFNSLTVEFDLALLELEHEVNYPVLPLLDSYSPLAAPGQMATAMGWGRTSSTSAAYADDLQQVSLPVISNALCNISYHNEITDNILCAGYAQGGKDACEGDSGGPLVVPSGQGWVQVGIVSQGEGCALPNYYGIYTRVSAFRDWISQQICASLPAPPAIQIELRAADLLLGWNSPGAAGYRLYYTPILPGLAWDIRSLDMGGASQISLPLAAFQVPYYAALRGYNGVCESGFSEIVRLP
jgi:secreted trypsin-like serine protease